MRLFTKALDGSVDWVNDTIDVLLLKTTGTDPANEYQFDPDDTYVDDILSGDGSEVGVSGYARQTISGADATVDNVNNWVKFDCLDLEFSGLGSGENVYGYLFCKRGSSDADSINIAFDNGRIPVVAAAPAALNATTIWVEPLLDDLPAGAPVDFGGGATGLLGADATVGARSISIAGPGIAAAVSAGDKASSVRTTRIKTQATPNCLAYLNGGDFSLTINANGVYVAQGRGNAT